MASLKDLRIRIGSVKNTSQITKTMKMVSAAKVRRARNACEAARPYAERLNNVLINLASTAGEGSSVLMAGRNNVKAVRLMVFGSDRGLCGAYNANIVKEALRQIAKLEAAGKQVQIVTIGRKVKAALQITNRKNIVASYDDISKAINFEKAEEIATAAVADFEAGQCDKVVLIYGLFVSMLNQAPTVQQLIPFDGETVDAAEGKGEFQLSTSFEYEPDETEILEVLLPRNINMQVFRAMLEGAASEHAARMTAMDNATRNAGEMMKKLKLVYNRQRQAAITTELVEIISGAEAL